MNLTEVEDKKMDIALEIYKNVDFPSKRPGLIIEKYLQITTLLVKKLIKNGIRNYWTFPITILGFSAKILS